MQLTKGTKETFGYKLSNQSGVVIDVNGYETLDEAKEGAKKDMGLYSWEGLTVQYRRAFHRKFGRNWKVVESKNV